jgi:hypothetical protein
MREESSLQLAAPDRLIRPGSAALHRETLGDDASFRERDAALLVKRVAVDQRPVLR